MKKTTLIATILSALLFIFFSALLYVRRADLAVLKLNELGDFFAGFAAPLAFIWLIAGYVQQGIELEQNTEALKSQQKELEEQVEATKTLAQQANRQANAIEESTQFSQYESRKNAELRATLRQPKFRIFKTKQVASHLTFAAYNYGAEVFDVEVIYNHFEIGSAGTVPKNKCLEFSIQGPFHSDIELTIVYVDNEGKHGRQMFQGSPDELVKIATMIDLPV